jgi:hypothetical protein
MTVGSGEPAKHERVEPVGLPAGDPEPVSCCGNLVGMQRQHPQTGVQLCSLLHVCVQVDEGSEHTFRWGSDQAGRRIRARHGAIVWFRAPSMGPGHELCVRSEIPAWRHRTTS